MQLQSKRNKSNRSLSYGNLSYFIVKLSLPSSRIKYFHFSDDECEEILRKVLPMVREFSRDIIRVHLLIAGDFVKIEEGEEEIEFSRRVKNIQDFVDGVYTAHNAMKNRLLDMNST